MAKWLVWRFVVCLQFPAQSGYQTRSASFNRPTRFALGDRAVDLRHHISQRALSMDALQSAKALAKDLVAQRDIIEKQVRPEAARVLSIP